MLPERRIDDHWNGDAKSQFVRLMDRIHEVYTVVCLYLLKGFLSSGERLTKNQATTRPGHLWQKYGPACQKQRWAIDEPKLDNARKLRGTYFMDPDGVLTHTLLLKPLARSRSVARADVRVCACGKTLKTTRNREKCVWYGVCVVWCCEGEKM